MNHDYPPFDDRPKESDLLCCPFCGEGDFDKIGLKGHLEHMDCEIYNNIETPRRIF